MPEAGELLAVEAIDQTGLVVTSEGAFVRILHVIPPEPDDPLRARTASGSRRRYCHLVSRLRPEQSLQFYVEARPVNLDELLARVAARGRGLGGRAPRARASRARDALALSRWRLYAAMEESLRLHADDQAAVQFNAYVVVPYLPSQRVGARACSTSCAPARRKLPVAPLERELKAHRRAVRESLAHTDAIRGRARRAVAADPAAERRGGRALLWARFNPTYADSGRRAALRAPRCSASSTRRSEREEARAAAPSCARRSRARASTSARRGTTSRSTATSSRRSTRRRPPTRPRWAG